MMFFKKIMGFYIAVIFSSKNPIQLHWRIQSIGQIIFFLNMAITTKYGPRRKVAPLLQFFSKEQRLKNSTSPDEVQKE
jgi:hypothetical protein